jgi:DNA-binding CsgD family transcriptional regulator
LGAATGGIGTLGSTSVSAPARNRQVLLERDAERATLERAFEEVSQGRSCLVFVEGPPGVGKTSLLDWARAAASVAGFTVRHARGSEFERAFPYGIVRQLFEPVITRAGPDDRAELLAGAAGLARPVLEGSAFASSERVTDRLAALHGLYWLTVNLAARHRLALVVDDLHWADASSLAWTHFLVRRMEGQGVLVLLATRTHEPGTRSALLEAIRSEPPAELLTPKPLSVDAVGELIEHTLGAAPHEGFSQSCLHATGGNPLLLRELLVVLADDHVRPTAREAEHVSAYGPQAISRAVLVRLARLPDEVTLAARALSVLAPGAHLGQLCELAGIGRDAAALAVDSLVETQVLVDDGTLEFIHPVVRSAIYEALPPTVRSRTHERAARLLAATGAPSEEVAGHLLAVHAGGEPWVVDQLRQSARQAVSRGAPDAAVALLRRAIAEPPPTNERPATLLELARAQASTADADGLASFAHAYTEVDDAHKRAEIALEWGRALQMTGATTDASEVFQRGIETLGDEDPALRRTLDGQRLAAMLADCETSRQATESLRAHRDAVVHEPDPEPMLLAACADGAAYVGEAMPQAVALARRALESLLDQPGPDALALAIYGCHTLRCADRLDEAGGVWDAVVAQAQRHGAILPFGAAACFRGETLALRGALREAEADLRAALDISVEHGLDIGRTWIAAHLIEVLVEQGELGSAVEIGEEVRVDERAATRLATNTLLCARGRARYEQGRPAEALADLTTCGRAADQGGVANPAVLPWRSRAALIHLRLGHPHTARELAYDELERARSWGAPRAVSVALRAAARTTTGGQQIELLREATTILNHSAARLEQAHADCDLGAALRRAGHRNDAREPLRRALDTAVHCAARPLAQRARDELIAAGARPRRDRIQGRLALTASEMRVASLAADGHTNREIAQALFVTPKTIETHLRHIYRKLGISGRQELSASLDQQ